MNSEGYGEDNNSAKNNSNLEEDIDKKLVSIEKNELNSDLRKAVQGTSILFIGTIFYTLCGMICSIIVARHYSVGEYGIYGLALFLVMFISGISSLGMNEACPRYIAYYRGKKDNEKIKGIINSSYIISILFSTTLTIIFFLFSDVIANSIFGISRLSYILKIFIISVPFWTVIKITVGIFRGYESVKERVYFSQISIQLLKVIFFSIIILLNFPIEYILAAFTGSIVITSFISILYINKKLPTDIKHIKKPELRILELVKFSWPLIISGLGWFIVSGLDKTMLGIIKTEVEVGLYNAAAPIAQYLIVFYSITIFIFQPIASRLYAENKMDEIKNNYQTLTKWIFSVSFPFIMILLIFPNTAIFVFYGAKYTAASTVLQLITIATFVHLLLALSGAMVTILGKTKIIMFATLTGGGINIVLNLLLIPLYGINGAAFSTMISYISIHSLVGLYLYRLTTFHPFRKKLLIPMIISFIVLFIFYLIIITFNLENAPLFYKIITSLLLVIFYFIIILKTKSYEKEDIQLFLLIEKRIGFKFKLLRKIFKLFL